jgi:hypothetical protein
MLSQRLENLGIEDVSEEYIGNHVDKIWLAPVEPPKLVDECTYLEECYEKHACIYQYP